MNEKPTPPKKKLCTHSHFSKFVLLGPAAAAHMRTSTCFSPHISGSQSNVQLVLMSTNIRFRLKHVVK